LALKYLIPPHPLHPISKINSINKVDQKGGKIGLKTHVWEAQVNQLKYLTGSLTMVYACMVLRQLYWGTEQAY